MFNTELLTSDPKIGPGGGGLPRASRHPMAPEGCRVAMSNPPPKPSLVAGFFVVRSGQRTHPTSIRRQFLSLIRARLWTALWPIVCALLTSCSCLPASTRPVSVRQPPDLTPLSPLADGDVNLRLLTYNTWGLPAWMNHAPKERYAGIARELQRLHPDLVLLQEVWTKAASAVVPTNGDWLLAQASSPNFFRRNGLLVLSRLPIIGGEFHPFNHAAFPDSVVRKGAMKITVLAPGGRLLNIWNVHLQSDAPRVRRRQIEQLVAWVRDANDGQVADLVGGDFNSTPDSREFKLLSRELGQTAHEVAQVPFSPTYDGLNPDPKKGRTIDYLFIRPRALITGLETAPSITFANTDLRRRFSDHVALEVALRFHADHPVASPSLSPRPQPVAYSPRSPTFSVLAP